MGSKMRESDYKLLFGTLGLGKENMRLIYFFAGPNFRASKAIAEAIDNDRKDKLEQLFSDPNKNKINTQPNSL